MERVTDISEFLAGKAIAISPPPLSVSQHKLMSQTKPSLLLNLCNAYSYFFTLNCLDLISNAFKSWITLQIIVDSDISGSRYYD